MEGTLALSGHALRAFVGRLLLVYRGQYPFSSSYDYISCNEAFKPHNHELRGEFIASLSFVSNSRIFDPLSNSGYFVGIL